MAKKFEKPKDLDVVKRQIDSIQQTTDSYRPIEIIEIENFVIKSDNLSQNTPKMSLEIKFTKNMTLEDLGKELGFPVKIEDQIAKRPIGYQGVLKGDIKYILTTVGSLTNTYWSFDDNVISFQQTKNIVFNFPFFSMDRINSIYNTGANAQDPFNVTVKDDIFMEMKTALTAVL